MISGGFCAQYLRHTHRALRSRLQINVAFTFTHVPHPHSCFSTINCLDSSQANPASSEQAPNAAAQSQSTSVAQLSRESSAVRQSLARSGSALATGTKLTLEDKLAARAHSGAANALAAAAATSRESLE